MSNSFHNKVAFITGGGSGIGRATALMLAAYGVSVIVADIDEAEGEMTATQIRTNNGSARFIQVDVSSEESIRTALQQIERLEGRLDFAVNSAGVQGIMAPTHEATIEDFDRVIAINLRGVWLSIKYEIPLILHTNGGSIVNVASFGGIVGAPYNAHYIASKHGIIGSTKTVALEYAQYNIRTNAVCPGIIDTPMLQRVAATSPEVINTLIAMNPLKRLGKAEEIASAIVWLCSDEAAFMNGHAMVLDGGFVIG